MPRLLVITAYRGEVNFVQDLRVLRRLPWQGRSPLMEGFGQLKVWGRKTLGYGPMLGVLHLWHCKETALPLLNGAKRVVIAIRKHRKALQIDAKDLGPCPACGE
jgi:hypothetical protein